LCAALLFLVWIARQDVWATRENALVALFYGGFAAMIGMNGFLVGYKQDQFTRTSAGTKFVAVMWTFVSLFLFVVIISVYNSTLTDAEWAGPGRANNDTALLRSVTGGIALVGFFLSLPVVAAIVFAATHFGQWLAKSRLRAMDPATSQLSPEGRLHARRVAELRARAGEPLELAVALRRLGDVQYREKQVADAEANYREALDLQRRHARAPSLELANSLRRIALLHDDAGRGEDAANHWLEAHDQYAAVGIQAGVAECAARLALLAHRSGESQRSRDWLARAEAAIGADKNPEVVAYIAQVRAAIGA
jgi:tetratricopeptide (TPR) repeat protein